MTLPIDLMLVRHGQSEGNKAKRLSEAGDHSAFTEAFRRRHTSGYRLSALGRDQARQAGHYLHTFGGTFDRFITSEYIRAMETAARLGLPNAQWLCDYNLTERDWGDLTSYPEPEREEKFGEVLRGQDVEPFFWRPPNGESFAQLCLRVDRALDTLHRECSDKRVIIVCHGEVMWAFRIRLERMSQVRFRELHFSQRSEDRIHNCQILHYTRRDVVTGRLGKYANWMRMIRPTAQPVWVTPWQEIVRPRYSNQELLAVVERTPAMVP